MFYQWTAEEIVTAAKLKATGVLYGADSGSGDAYAVTSGLSIAALVAGMELTFEAGATNVGACTLNLDTLGAVGIRKWKSGVLDNLDDGDIQDGANIKVVYDGTYWQAVGGLQAPPASGPSVITMFGRPFETQLSGAIAHGFDRAIFNEIGGSTIRIYRNLSSDPANSVYFYVGQKVPTEGIRKLTYHAGDDCFYGTGQTIGKVYQYTNADNPTETLVTFSGTAPSSTNVDITSDGTYIYVLDGATTLRKYSVSGTTLTHVSDVTLATSHVIQGSVCARNGKLYSYDFEATGSRSFDVWIHDLATGALDATIALNATTPAKCAGLMVDGDGKIRLGCSSASTTTENGMLLLCDI